MLIICTISLPYGKIGELFKMRKMDNKYKIIIVAIIAVWIVGTIIYVVISYNNAMKTYHYIELDNASCVIPLRMWKPDEDEIYTSKHMFRITDKEKNYIIYASQLEQYDQDDEQYGLFYRFDEGLLDYESDTQAYMGIKNSSDILERVTETRVHTKNINDPPYVQYRILGEAGGEYEGYKTYIATSKARDNDVRFVFILLYRDPESLSEKEMYDMWFHYLTSSH